MGGVGDESQGYHPTDEDLSVHPNELRPLAGDPVSVGTPDSEGERLGTAGSRGKTNADPRSATLRAGFRLRRARRRAPAFAQGDSKNNNKFKSKLRGRTVWSLEKQKQKQPQIPVRLRSGQAFDFVWRAQRGLLRSG